MILAKAILDIIFCVGLYRNFVLKYSTNPLLWFSLLLDLESLQKIGWFAHDSMLLPIYVYIPRLALEVTAYGSVYNTDSISQLTVQRTNIL